MTENETSDLHRTHTRSLTLYRSTLAHSFPLEEALVVVMLSGPDHRHRAES